MPRCPAEGPGDKVGGDYHGQQHGSDGDHLGAEWRVNIKDAGMNTCRKGGGPMGLVIPVWRAAAQRQYASTDKYAAPAARLLRDEHDPVNGFPVSKAIVCCVNQAKGERLHVPSDPAGLCQLKHLGQFLTGSGDG